MSSESNVKSLMIFIETSFNKGKEGQMSAKNWNSKLTKFKAKFKNLQNINLTFSDRKKLLLKKSLNSKSSTTKLMNKYQ